MFGSIFVHFRSGKIAPAPEVNAASLKMLSTASKSTESTQSTLPGSPTGSESDSRRSSGSSDSVTAPSSVIQAEKMPEIEALIKIRESIFFLDAISTSDTDEECYQHNRKIIGTMINLSTLLVDLPNEHDAVAIKSYIERIRAYDIKIDKITRQFDPEKPHGNSMLPKMNGKKSAVLAELYKSYLSSYIAKDYSEKLSPSLKVRKEKNAENNRPLLDTLQHNLHLLNGVNIGKEINLIKSNMHESVILRNKRLQALASPEKSLKELAVEKTLGNEKEKKALLEQAIRKCLHFTKAFRKEVSNNPKKYPVRTPEDSVNFIDDLLYSKIPDTYLLFVRFHDDELLCKIRDQIIKEKQEMAELFSSIDKTSNIESDIFSNNDASSVVENSVDDELSEDRSENESEYHESVETENFNDDENTEEQFDENLSTSSRGSFCSC